MPCRSRCRREPPGAVVSPQSRDNQSPRDGERGQDEKTPDEALIGSLSEIDEIEGRLLVLRQSITTALRRLAEDRKLRFKPWAVRQGEAEPVPKPSSAADSRPRLIRLREVIARVGLSRTSVYGLVERGEFPKPVRLAARSVAWWEPDLDRWIESRVSGSNGSSVESR